MKKIISLLLGTLFLAPQLALGALNSPGDVIRKLNDGSPQIINANIRFFEPDEGDILIRMRGAVQGKKIEDAKMKLFLDAGADIKDFGKIDFKFDMVLYGQKFYLRINQLNIKPTIYDSIYNEFQKFNPPKNWLVIPLDEKSLQELSQNSISRELSINELYTNIYGIDEKTMEEIAYKIIDAIFSMDYLATSEGNEYTFKLKRDFMQEGVKTFYNEVRKLNLPADNQLNLAAKEMAFYDSELKTLQKEILDSLRLNWKIITDKYNRFALSSFLMKIKVPGEELQATFKVRNTATTAVSVSPPANALSLEKYLELIEKQYR